MTVMILVVVTMTVMGLVSSGGDNVLHEDDGNYHGYAHLSQKICCAQPTNRCEGAIGYECSDVQLVPGEVVC